MEESRSQKRPSSVISGSSLTHRACVRASAFSPALNTFSFCAHGQSQVASGLLLTSLQSQRQKLSGIMPHIRNIFVQPTSKGYRGWLFFFFFLFFFWIKGWAAEVQLSAWLNTGSHSAGVGVMWLLKVNLAVRSNTVSASIILSIFSAGMAETCASQTTGMLPTLSERDVFLHLGWALCRVIASGEKNILQPALMRISVLCHLSLLNLFFSAGVVAT